jgi:hypothetical protein
LVSVQGTIREQLNCRCFPLVRSSDYGKWTAGVAQSEAAPFLDLNEIIATRYDTFGGEKVEPLFADPHTHTSRAGAELNAECVVEALTRLRTNPLAPYLQAAKCGRYRLQYSTAVEAEECLDRARVETVLLERAGAAPHVDQLLEILRPGAWRTAHRVGLPPTVAAFERAAPLAPGDPEIRIEMPYSLRKTLELEH